MKITRLVGTNGKAIAIESENKIELQSYDTIIAKIENGVCKIVNENMISRTTCRHIHEFCRFYGVKAPEIKITY